MLPLDSCDGRGYCAKRKIAQRRLMSRLQFKALLTLEQGHQALRAIRALRAWLRRCRQPKVRLLGGMEESPQDFELLVREEAVGMEDSKQRHGLGGRRYKGDSAAQCARDEDRCAIVDIAADLFQLSAYASTPTPTFKQAPDKRDAAANRDRWDWRIHGSIFSWPHESGQQDLAARIGMAQVPGDCSASRAAASHPRTARRRL